MAVLDPLAEPWTLSIIINSVVDLLAADEAEALRESRLTYNEVGGTRNGAQPGYGWLSKSRQLSTAFEPAVEALMSWQVQERAGLKVAASAPVVGVGVVLVMRFGPGPCAVAAPCRVVYLIDEPDRRGFAYGTLPGHAETGEELFVLTRLADGRAHFTIEAFSQPATALARLGGPVTRLVQARMTDRYLRAIDG